MSEYVCQNMDASGFIYWEICNLRRMTNGKVDCNSG